ncbi:transporter substrate-binding domain-containing protein [Amaricoccus macauensis]|uniref:transporter substrate-binding domain-containing protein n=1 Tax=Amaricoccus macauensis TaxID=57001 RepID=UPI003C7BBD43
MPLLRASWTRLILMWAVVLPSVTLAQDREIIDVPWTAAAGLAKAEANGDPSGFFVDLSRAIAEEAGFDVRFREYETVQEALQAQSSGETQMLSGIAQTVPLAETNVFSVPVAKSTVNLFVRAEEPFGVLPERLEGRRIGTVAQILGQTFDELSARNEIVDYPDQMSAFGALLVGDIDGVVTRYQPAAVALARARIDYRVRVAGLPLRSENRLVAIHESRFDLLPRVNSAIARLEADGRLNSLRVLWNMTLPEPMPEVLTVGFLEFPPHQVIGPNGSFTGFGVEALRHLANRADLTLEIREITREEWLEGPGASYDMLPPLSVSPDRQLRMDFTLPLQRMGFSIFTRQRDAPTVSGLPDLADSVVGVFEQSISIPVAQAEGVRNFRTFDSADDMVDALVAGEVDAVLYPTTPMRGVLEDRGLIDEVKAVPGQFMVTERGVALRPGLGVVRERLNGVIPGYLSSEEFAALRDRWLGEPQFWTPERRRAAWIAAAALSAFVLLAFLVQTTLARWRAEALAAETRAVSNRLGAILDAAQSGIVGLTEKGIVAVANPGARKLLGRPDAETPFDWPDDATFMDPHDLSLLGTIRSPIKRALSGETLRGEIALLRNDASSEPPRYVRLSSAPVADRAPSDISTVIILDDVTEQERTRQQVERSGRLDALGQLTGGIAHDFNNILATIEYGIELASVDVSGKARTFLDRARTSVRRGSELTNRLLAFAKQQPGAEKSVRVGEVLSEFQKLAQPTIERSIDLTFAVEDEDLIVHCDVGKLENALLNLVLNSRDAILQAGKGDRITVQVRGLPEFDRVAGEEPRSQRDVERSGPCVEFSVTDNGPGMPEEVKRRATDPFFTTKGKASGTGLGLSMVFGFVQQAEGVLRIYSEVGHGTTVRLVLPRGTEHGQVSEPEAKVSEAKGTGQRILIVEDEPDLLAAVSEIVRSMNYEVLEADSGRDAIARIEAGLEFDLLLTDVVMPGGVGGFDLAKVVRERWPSIPIIYMSGYAGIQEREMGGVVAPTLQKPCPPSDLARMLRQQLGTA